MSPDLRLATAYVMPLGGRDEAEVLAALERNRKHLRHEVARAHLYGVMARYGWTLWASIQASVSPIDFDFWSWGMEKYVRAVEELDGPDLEHLLTEAVRPD